MRVEDSSQVAGALRMFRADIRLAEWEMEALENWAREQPRTLPVTEWMIAGFNRLLCGELRFVRRLEEVAAS